MKCKKCGKEIIGDSNFCEYCGTKVANKSPKGNTNNIWWKSITAILAVMVVGSLVLLKSRIYQGVIENPNDSIGVNIPYGYVDLGLPSGTLWKNKNEVGLYTYQNAIEKYCDSVPSQEQFEELISMSKWIWVDGKYEIKGSNGNTIVMPADFVQYNINEHLYCFETVADFKLKKKDNLKWNARPYGAYWSSSSNDQEYATGMRFNSDNHELNLNAKNIELSVRLAINNRAFNKSNNAIIKP